MGRNTVVWRKLYKLSDQLQKLKPWEYIWSGDYICIELAPDDVVYCIVMGRNGDCIGLSIYEGAGHPGQKAGEAVGSKGLLYGAADEFQPKAAARQK